MRFEDFRVELHFKKAVVCGFVLTGGLLFFNMLAYCSKVELFAKISSSFLIPLAWIWELFGVYGCTAMGYLVYIILSVPLYYFLCGFLIGYFYSVAAYKISDL